MELLKRIESEMKDSLKSNNKLTAETMRMLKSDIMYEKAKTGKDLSDEKILEIISRAAKRRKESIKEFKKANRIDLFEKEEAELVIIEKYLPEQMNEEAIEKYIDDKLSEIGEVDQNNFGKIMGPIMKDLKGKADGGLVKNILNKKLDSK